MFIKIVAQQQDNSGLSTYMERYINVQTILEFREWPNGGTLIRIADTDDDGAVSYHTHKSVALLLPPITTVS